MKHPLDIEHRSVNALASVTVLRNMNDGDEEVARLLNHIDARLREDRREIQLLNAEIMSLKLKLERLG
jgi:hypothetical protein